MSADRRKQILIGFGALAVVLVAVIVIVRPTFRSDEATGAIGAVQKHHAPQIAKQDVILGDEQVKRDQKILFADYLADAKDLKSFSWGSAQARAESVSRLRAKEQEVGVRFNEDLGYALGMAKQLANDEPLNLGAKRENALGIIAMLIGQHATNAQEMSTLALKLNDVADVVGSANVDMAHLEISSLASAERSLDAISRAQMQDRLIAAVDALDMMAKESALLHEASLQAANLNEADAMSLGTRFSGMVADLEHRAQTNAKSELTLASVEISALGRMSESLTRFESASNAADRAKVESLRRDLNVKAVAVQDSLNAMGAVNAQYASMLGNDDSFGIQVRALSDQVQDVGSRVRAVGRVGDPSRETHPIRDRGPRKR